MREVEREDRRILGLGDRHDRRVDESQTKRCVALVDLDGSPEEHIREVHTTVRAIRELLQERSCRVSTSALAHQPIGLHDDRLGNQEIPADTRYERGRQVVRLVPRRERRDEWSCIDDYRGRSSSVARASSTYRS